MSTRTSNPRSDENQVNDSAGLRYGFCIFIKTIFQGVVPSVSDGDDKYVVFETKQDAQQEIWDCVRIRVMQFLKSNDEWDLGTVGDEYVLVVTLSADGLIRDEAGNCFSQILE